VPFYTHKYIYIYILYTYCFSIRTFVRARWPIMELICFVRISAAVGLLLYIRCPFANLFIYREDCNFICDNNIIAAYPGQWSRDKFKCFRRKRFNHVPNNNTQVHSFIHIYYNTATIMQEFVYSYTAQSLYYCIIFKCTRLRHCVLSYTVHLYHVRFLFFNDKGREKTID